MVQNMLQVISRPGSVNEASAPDMLTPTTLKNLTELFESDHCLKQVQAVENGEEFVTPQPPQEKRKKNPLKLESTPFVGGTVIIRTPTDSEQMTILDPAPVQTNKPAPTNQILAMKTRSSSRIRTPTAVVQPQQIVVAARKQATVKRTPPKSRPGVKAVQDDSDLSPEEVERLRIRRERNKQAAARCRKRRMDTISTLEDEVRQLENKKRIHEDEIANLREEKMQLEYILSQHQAECKLFNQMSNFENDSSVPMSLPMAVKSEPVVVQAIETFELNPNLSTAVVAPRSSTGGLKPKRPLTLTISQSDAKNTLSGVEGVTIETPSNGLITSLGFENLLTSTGLTPTTNIITPISFSTSSVTSSSNNSCSSQQRSSELSTLTDLNTPCNENISLVSL